jgi:formylglycine-generating enzyme required for sulfatase activity
MTRAWPRRAGWVALALWVSSAAAQAMVVKDYDPTGPQPSVVDEKGERRALYKQSHALLISVSDYLGPGRKGWKPLKETGREMDRVAEALRPHGFRVRRVSDPNGVELQTAIQGFLAEYGRDENHRLLVFFSGHGHTDRDTDMGYLVPTDALDPNLNAQGFFNKALPIESLQTSAKSIRARHAVFLFDSCFSGSIFMSKALPTQPEPRGASVSERFRFLTGKAAQPVRQFIAAGGPDEPLPAQSQFVPLFIQALSGSGSRVGDGYVTGKELGAWLEQTLPSYNRHQNPHSDVIKVPQLSFGDVVFQVPGAVVPVPVPVRPPEPPVVQAETRSAPPPADPFPPGKRFRDCEDAACPWMVVVRAGSFMMGSPTNEPGRKSDEGPQRRVSISKFAMGQYEVTQGQWKALMGSNPSHFKDCGDECPVEQVSWDDAQKFVKKLNAKTGKAYRLPSEAEWEYAARAGTTTAYAFGATLSALHANCGEGSFSKTFTVGDYPANNFGLSDMHGSVWEWTADRYGPYQSVEVRDPVVHQDQSTRRVLRGGSWINLGWDCRSASRSALGPVDRGSIIFSGGIGFRLARGLAD